MLWFHISLCFNVNCWTYNGFKEHVFKHHWIKSSEFGIWWICICISTNNSLVKPPSLGALIHIFRLFFHCWRQVELSESVAIILKIINSRLAVRKITSLQYPVFFLSLFKHGMMFWPKPDFRCLSSVYR